MREPQDPPSGDDWIIVPRWGEFQHYRNRNPRWIKVYSKLLQDPNYLSLSMAAKGLLQVIWLAYSQQNGRLSVANLFQISRKKLSYPQLIALNRAGFVEWSASEPLAQELDLEIETPYPLTDKDAHQRLLADALDVATEWGSRPSGEFQERLDELQIVHESKLETMEREHLYEVVFQRARQRTTDSDSTSDRIPF